MKNLLATFTLMIKNAIQQHFLYLASAKDKLNFAFWTAIFFGLFFFLFDPFKTSGAIELSVLEGLYQVAIISGGVFMGMVTSQFLLRRLVIIKEKSHVINYLIFFLLEVGIITIAELLLYDLITGYNSFELYWILWEYSSNILVMTFPYSYSFMYVILIKQRNEIKNLNTLIETSKRTNSIKNSNLVIEIQEKDQLESLQILESEILFIKADDNYLELYFEKNGNLQRTLIRSTLKSFLEKYDFSNITKCHRSYAVNVPKIKSAKRTSNGLLLDLNYELSLPVSRSFLQPIKEAIRA